MSGFPWLRPDDIRVIFIFFTRKTSLQYPIQENPMNGKSPSLTKTVYRIVVIFILAALLPGCSFGNLPTISPTIDTRPTFEAIKTQAALTVVAELTRSAPQGKPSEPTATLVMVTATEAPTPTETTAPTAIPTFTPVPPTPTNTRVPPTLAPAATWTPVSVNCKITEQSVSFGDDFPKNADFDGKWVVKNTGTTTWSSSAVDIKYISGTKFQTHVDILDLGADVAVDGSYTVVIDMRAPDKAGRYSSTWAFVQGGTTLCILPMTIDVKN